MEMNSASIEAIVRQVLASVNGSGNPSANAKDVPATAWYFGFVAAAAK